MSPFEAPERLPEKSEGKVIEYLNAASEDVNLELARVFGEVPRAERSSIAADFRIQPPEALYSPKKEEVVQKALGKQFGSADEAVVQEKEKDMAGIKFELLKTAIMHRNLKSRFFVLRSSRYDDIVNGVDNIIVDKTTGETVCALDEISARDKFSADERLAEKKKKVLGMNFGIPAGFAAGAGAREAPHREQGATLAYGLELSAGAFRCKEVKHLPIFLLALDGRRLDEGLANFDPNPQSRGSEYERRLCDFFLKSIALQIQELKLDVHGYENLPADLRGRIENFERFIEESKK